MKAFWNKYHLKWLTLFNPWVIVHELGHILIAFGFSFAYGDERPEIQFVTDSFLGFDVVKGLISFSGTKTRKNIVKSMGFVFEFSFSFLLLGSPFLLALWLFVSIVHFALYFHTASPEYSDFNLIR